MARLLVVPLAVVAALAGCGPGRSATDPDPVETNPLVPAANPDRSDRDSGSGGDGDPSAEPCGSRRELATGLLWETVVATRTPPVDLGDRCIHLLRIDLAHYRLQALTAAIEGAAHPAPEWAERYDLVAVINASMYRPDLRSTGLLIADGVVAGLDNPKFGAFLAFSPTAADTPAARLFGRGCPDFDLPAIRAGYRSVVQSYRLFDCAGAPIAWKDDKAYSAAAIALDRDGRVVFVHLRTPYLMRDVTEMLAAPELGLAAAMFVEGGPEATLHVAAPGFHRTLVGSYESGFHESDDNQQPWPLPNVIGVAARPTGSE